MRDTIKRMSICGMLALVQAGPAAGALNVDSAANYGGGWTNGANGGGGFGAWSLAAESGAGWAGCGIWDSAAASLDLGMAFGFVAKGTGSSVTMERSFAQALAVGDTFKLDLGMNHDAGTGGNKGFSLRTADDRDIVVVNQADDEVITVNGVAALTRYGVGTMHWTFTQVSATQVMVYATGRGGSEAFSATVGSGSASHLAKIHCYASAVADDEYAEYRQVYFDNLTLNQGASDTNLFRYSIENGRAVVTGVLASAEGDLVVPATLGGYPVGSVGRGAFQNLARVTGVAFADGAGVTNIGSQAFQGCTALAVVALPDGLTALSPGLFFGCSALGAVTIPGGVTNIGAAAFAECRSLTAVTLPERLSGLGESLFLNCRSLAVLHWPDGLADLPGQSCYECRSLAGVDFPSALTRIGSAAFFNCFGLEKIQIERSLEFVGDQAFAGCDRLERVYFLGGVEALGANVFGNCTGLGGVYILGEKPAAGPDDGEDLFTGAGEVTVYYLTDGSSWSEEFGGMGTRAWTPEASELAVAAGMFRFAVEWVPGRSILVQACSRLEASETDWEDVGLYVPVEGRCSVADPAWGAATTRYYRVVSP